MGDVHFQIVSGPNANNPGATVNVGPTGPTFTWTGTTPGVDTVTVTFVGPEFQTFDDIKDKDGSDGKTTQCVPVDEDIPTDPSKSDFDPRWICTDTYTASATKTWILPPPVVPPVVVQPLSTATISLTSKCVKKNYTVTPTVAGNSAVKTSTLFVDGKQYKQLTVGPYTFTIKAAKLKPGNHRVTVITGFQNGQTSTAKGTLTRCAVRVVQRRIKPKFTG